MITVSYFIIIIIIIVSSCSQHQDANKCVHIGTEPDHTTISMAIIPTGILPTAPTPVSNPAPSPVSAPSVLPEVQFVGNPCGDEFSDGLCTLCSGDCDRNSDCAGDLICFPRSGGEDVPGCTWGANSATLKAEGHDYCKLFYRYCCL